MASDAATIEARRPETRTTIEFDPLLSGGAGKRHRVERRTQDKHVAEPSEADPEFRDETQRTSVDSVQGEVTHRYVEGAAHASAVTVRLDNLDLT